ncbi:transglutaminase domain-containing protein [Tenacibaculum sp. MEBiC06402]|uniref:transglutaminase domain-containing protein n=1 Tax=unclassified Tenacibaculum TaxID=2635139 RepID=UPI003B9C2604
MRILFVALFISITGFSQDFSAINLKIKEYPKLLSAEELANYIREDFSSKESKVKALYSWLTENIRYDLEEFYNPNRVTKMTFRYQTLEERDRKLRALHDEIVDETLSSRKAVCEGYARTFAKVCTLLNIENEVIEGYVRSSSNRIGKPLQSPNHSWNAVKLNGNWIYIDATWGAGSEYNGRWIRKFNPYYYNIPKDKYFKTHLPEKSIWKLRVGRIEKEEYYNQPIYSHEFLKSNVELSSPSSGILNRKSDGSVLMELQNATDKEILVGFLGSTRAVKPKTTNKGEKTIVSIVPPPGAKALFLLINREVALEFLIQ